MQTREDRYLAPACEPAALCLIALLTIAWGCGTTEIRLAVVAAGIVGLALLYREYLRLRQEAERLRAHGRPRTPADFRLASSLARNWNSTALGQPAGQPPCPADGTTPVPGRLVAVMHRGAAVGPHG